jgi:hypothetical protein
MKHKIFPDITTELLLYTLTLPLVLFIFTLGYATATHVLRQEAMVIVKREADLIKCNQELQIENERLKQKLSETQSAITSAYKKHTRLLEVSAYSLRPCETDSDPSWSSFGPTVYGQVAVSQNMIASGEFSRGDHLLIRTPDNKVFFRVVNDQMNKRYKTNVDLLFENTWLAKKFGRKQAVVVNLTKINHELLNL